MTATLTLSPIHRPATFRRRDTDRGTASGFLVAALFVAVLIAAAVVVAVAASHIPDVGSIYITTT
jgi:hypothetical protein